MNENPTAIDLLNRAKNYLMNMNDSVSFEIAMEIQKFLDAKQEANYIDSTTL